MLAELCYLWAEVKYMKPKKVGVSLSLDEDIIVRLREIAEEDDRTLSSCINLILRDYLRSLDEHR